MFHLRPWSRPLPLVLLGGALTLAAGVAFSDSHRDDDDDDWSPMSWRAVRADVRPVSNPGYAEECGACHMAYQPGLLPAASWDRVLAPESLLDHYGDDASLPEETRVAIRDYLLTGAADQGHYSRERSFSALPGALSRDATLPRITETPYFVRKHHEIPVRLVLDNPEVGSFSRCNACHANASDGIYHEHQVRIPGFGRWED